MENKEKEKTELNIKFEKILIISTSLAIVLYFFYGFYSDENSAGAGGYDGDFKLIWENLLLLKQSIVLNLNNSEYSDSRSPLSYILHILFNPYITNKEDFRTVNLVISSSVPILLFFSIKQNFKNLDKSFIILLSIVITLSPYFRTTSYWALGENYGIIFLLLSYLMYSKINKDIFSSSNFKKNLSIFLLCFFSSIIVYFDQKLVFIPFLVLFLIFSLNIKINIKINSLIFFFIFASPYFYLMYLWEGLIPSSANVAREVGSRIHLYNPGYCLTIIAISIFPFIFSKKLGIKSLKREIFNAKNYFFFGIFFIYVLLIFTYGDFINLSEQGKGAFHKLSLLLVKDVKIRLFLSITVFLISALVVVTILKDKQDLYIVLYFLILSLFTFPFYQEYLDPLLYVLIFSFFKSNFELSNKKTLFFIFFYYLIFSLSSKYYYQITI
jgi:hypothetical protein